MTLLYVFSIPTNVPPKRQIPAQLMKTTVFFFSTRIGYPQKEIKKINMHISKHGIKFQPQRGNTPKFPS